MTDCPFCDRIERAEYDDIDLGTVHFEPLNPVTPGHRLFVPEEHQEHSDALVVDSIESAMGDAARWGRGRGEDFNLIISSGSAATQTVAHVHVHYVPRREGDGLALPWTGQEK